MLNDISYEVAYIFFYMQYYLPCDILNVLDFFPIAPQYMGV